MAQDLQSLLDKIHEEGFKKAESEKEAILKAAREEAARIRADAENDARERIARAEAENKLLTERSRAALNQAARDVALKLGKELEKRIRTALSDAVGAALTPEAMSQMILAIAKAAAADPDAGVELLVSSRDRAKLEAALGPMLKDSFKNAPRVLADAGVRGGFQISVGEGSCYTDFSTGALTELLIASVGGKLAALLKEA